MPRRSVVSMDKARAVVTRLTAQGMSVHGIARKAGVGRDTVLRWQNSENLGRITNTAAAPDASKPVRSGITWSEALDAAWDVRRRVGGRATYRAMLRRWAASFAELIDPVDTREGIRAVSATGCACDPSDLRRSPCPGHVVPLRT